MGDLTPRSRTLRLWVDIDNPPQARYLLPLARRIEEMGHDIVMTARAYGETLAILETEGASFEPIGSGFGKGFRRKLFGLYSRTRQLDAFVRGRPERPTMLLTGSRSATLVARGLGIPSFVIVDYEYVDLLIFQLARTHIVYPDVIDPVRFRRRGIPAGRLLPFKGLKEDISFTGFDLASVRPHDFGGNSDAPRILFRPPAEDSHYFRPESRELALKLLEYLASEGAKVIFVPRSQWQVRYLEGVSDWKTDPVIVEKPIPFVALLKGVDAVVSAGGTMLREAAYLGVPAYSVFRSSIGAVDRYLASVGRLSIITSSDDFSRIRLGRRPPVAPLRDGRAALDDVVEMLLGRARAFWSTRP